MSTVAGERHAYVTLLRGINVAGKNRIPMAGLHSICTANKCEGVQTYIQSGNVVFTSPLSIEALERSLEQAIEQEFRLSIPVVVRSASGWGRYVKGNPFPNEAKEEANRVLLSLSKLPPKANVVSELKARATRGERVVKKGDAIWIHYAGGIGRSKLTPAVMDRYVGSPVTARNWRTVLKLDEMVRKAIAG